MSTGDEPSGELRLNGIEKSYGEFRLGPIDLAIDREVLSVLGPSGCGKSTLLSIIAGIVKPEHGSVRLGGTDITDRPTAQRGTVLVFQNGALFPHMSARENVAYAATSPGRIEDLAATLEIESVLDQRADTLSGGERQRVALARALATDPTALLLDEPLSSLDAPIRRRLREELRDVLASLSVPVVYVTHDRHEATVIGDRLAVMGTGSIHQLGTPRAVFDRPATPFVASFTGTVNCFEARVVESGHRPVLQWGEKRVAVPEYGFDSGTPVWFCVRPEYIEVGPPNADRGESTGTAFEARVTRRLFEGEDYLLTVRPDGVANGLRCRVAPPTYERLGLAERDRVRVTLDSSSIHLIDRS